MSYARTKRIILKTGSVFFTDLYTDQVMTRMKDAKLEKELMSLSNTQTPSQTFYIDPTEIAAVEPE